MTIKFYVLDLETTGLQWKNNFHEICEFSILRADDRVQLSRQVKVKKPQNASIDALRITNKTAEDLKRGIPMEKLIEEVEEFLSEDNIAPDYRCLVGHNVINFDRKFLWQTWDTYGKYFPFSLYLDTMNMTKAFIKKNGLAGHKANLQNACDLLNIKKQAGAHNAKSDTRNTYLLWQKLIETVDHLDFIKCMPHKDENEAEAINIE